MKKVVDTNSDRLKPIPEGSRNQKFSEPELRFSNPKPKILLRREILTYILNFFKWVFYNLILIYAGQRVVNFLNDPYLEDSYNEPFTSDVFIVMLVQSLGFLVIGGLVVSGYKLLFKRKYTWQNIFTFVITLIIVLIGVFL